MIKPSDGVVGQGTVTPTTGGTFIPKSGAKTPDVQLPDPAATALVTPVPNPAEEIGPAKQMNGYTIHPVRSEWKEWMESDTTAFHGNYKAGGMSTPGDLPFVDGKEMTVARHAVFEEVGLSNLEKAGVERPFNQDITITRKDGSQATINLAKAPDGSVPIDDFNLASEEILKRQSFDVLPEVAKGWGFACEPGQATVKITGVQVLAAIDKLLDECVRLGDLGQAHPIPRPTDGTRDEYLKTLRQFAVNNIWHSVGLTRMHQAAGRDVTGTFNETLGHNLYEPAPLRDLAWQMMKFRHEPWMDNWLRAEMEKQVPGITKDLSNDQLYAVMVNGPGTEKLVQRLRGEDDPTNRAMARMQKIAAEDPLVQERLKLLGGKELQYNPNALSPHYYVAMFEWGASREDSNTLCHPHRDCEHHDGTSSNPINLAKRMTNGAWHHAGVEIWPNVRHEYYLGFDGDGPVGSFKRFTEEVLKKDTAFRSPIIQKGSFEMAKYLRAMMQAGYVPPAHKVAVPERSGFVNLVHAYGELQENNVAADNRVLSLRAEVQKGLAAGVPVALRQAVDAFLGTLDPVSNKDVEKRFEQVVRASDMGEQQGKLVADLGQLAQARLVQLSSSTVERAIMYNAIADRLSQRVVGLVPGRPPLKFLDAHLAVELREKLQELPEAIERSRERGDTTMAQYYESWWRHVESGFGSSQH